MFVGACNWMVWDKELSSGSLPSHEPGGGCIAATSLRFAARSQINIISLPRRKLDIDAETLAGSPDLVLRRHDEDAAVLLLDVVHVEGGSRGSDPLARGLGCPGDDPASLPGPGVARDVRNRLCVDGEHVGAVQLETDFFYCIDELWLIWKLKVITLAFCTRNENWTQ